MVVSDARLEPVYNATNCTLPEANSKVAPEKTWLRETIQFPFVVLSLSLFGVGNPC